MRPIHLVFIEFCLLLYCIIWILGTYSILDTYTNVLRHSRHVGIAGNNNVNIIDVDVQIEEPDMDDVKDRGSD